MYVKKVLNFAQLNNIMHFFQKRINLKKPKCSLSLRKKIICFVLLRFKNHLKKHHGGYL